MKVLLYSHAFYPSTGGVETVSMELANGLVRCGIEIKVVTRTPRENGIIFDFELINEPDGRQVRELVKWADVVLFNGASLALQPWVLLARKPFVWVHVGYQACTVDGAGWFDGAPAPLTPWASVRRHARRGVFVGLREGLKLAIRRLVATRLVTRNIAITRWMADANPLPRQVQIYNPFPTERFAPAALRTAEPDYDFMYLGRLVSEKGVDTLLKAFAEVVAQRAATAPRLLIVGDGDRRKELEALADRLNVRSAVAFVGNQRDRELVNWVSRGRIAVVPSAWHEPMGGVVVELMAAARSLIVSAHGGLSECMGDAGLVFPNGDHRALASQMIRLLDDKVLQASQSARALQRALDFAPSAFVDQYIALLREVTNKVTPPKTHATGCAAGQSTQCT